MTVLPFRPPAVSLDDEIVDRERAQALARMADVALARLDAERELNGLLDRQDRTTTRHHTDLSC
jgi:hypothetical protein